MTRFLPYDSQPHHTVTFFAVKEEPTPKMYVEWGWDEVNQNPIGEHQSASYHVRRFFTFCEKLADELIGCV
jgi:hypothetical protein